jgi:hypothetical protein
VRVLGRFGDTHLTPGVLLDPGDRRSTPPPGTIDVQFRVPVSLSLMLDAVAATDRRAEIVAWAAGYQELVSRLLSEVQRAGGFALDSSDTTVPAQLFLAATVEQALPDLGTRWHCHVWVGPTALTISEGARRPVAAHILGQRIQSQVWAVYVRELEALTTRELGVRWSEPRPGAAREIVEPPWYEHVGATDRGVCPGPWGTVGPVLLADEQDLRVHAEMERSHDVAVGQGTAFPPLDNPASARTALMRGLVSGRSAQSATPRYPPPKAEDQGS